MLDTPLTYSLFEYARSSADEIVLLPAAESSETSQKIPSVAMVTKKKEPKEHFSKQTKRKMADRTS